MTLERVTGMEMILFIGMQATGKSTFYLSRFCDTHVRINLDMLKTRNRERILTAACFTAKQPFVVDNTNPTMEDRQRYIDQAKNHGFKIIGYYFQSSIADAVARNNNRSGNKKIPQAALLSTHKKLELPSLREGFDALWYVRMDGSNSFVTEEFKDEL